MILTPVKKNIVMKIVRKFMTLMVIQKGKQSFEKH